MKITLKRDGLTGDNLKFVEALEASINDALKEASGGITEKQLSDAVEAAKASFPKDMVTSEKMTAEIDGLKDILATQGNLINELKAAKPANAQAKSLRDQIKNYLTSNKDAWDAFRRGESKSFGATKDGAGIELVFKDAANMTVGGSTNSSAFIPQIELVPGLINLQRNQPFIMEYANVSSTSSPRIVRTEKTDPQGQAQFIGEGVLKPLVSFEIVTNESFAKKIADKIKVSTEMLDDIDFIAGEIEKELKYLVDINTDTQLLSGSGDGSSGNANLQGLASIAGKYVLTTVNTSTPNDTDAIRAAMAQIASLNFTANFAFVNPIDGANMDLQKGSTGYYVMPPFQSADGKTISGVRIIESNQVPVGSVLVADMSRFMVRPYKPFTIQYGWVNSDFEENLVTIIGEQRLHAYVAQNHVGAFVYDTFANIKTAIAAA